MNHNKKMLTLIIFLCSFVLLSGCWDQKIYEKIGFILQLGLEEDEVGDLKYTVGVPLISPEANGKIEVLTTSIGLVREGRDKVRHTSGKTVEGGKVQHIYFSEGLAKRGINEFLEIFIRSPENPLVANIIVVEGSPNELIRYSNEYTDKPRPAFYVNGLIENARKNSYAPLTRVSDFTILTLSETIDPTVPLIRYNKKEIEVIGAALFDSDKMVGKISTKDTGLLNGLMEIKKDINYIYEGPYSKKREKDLTGGAAILMRINKRKIYINLDKNKPVIDIKLDFKGSISEYSGSLDLSNPEDKAKLEENIGDAIQKDCSRLLKYLTEVGSDPVGFGEIVRTKHNNYWKSTNWKDVYGSATFNIEVKIGFEFYGAISNSQF